MNVSRNSIALLGLAVVLIAVTALTVGRHSLRDLASSLGIHQTRMVHEGQPLPALSFTSVDGNAQTLGPATIPARVTVINIFTSWCPSCKEETPAFADAARDATAKTASLSSASIRRSRRPR